MSFYKEVPGRKTTLESSLKFDIAPTEGSTNPVTSDGVKCAIDGAVGDVSEALQQQIDDIAEKAGSGYIPKGEATVATLNGLSGQDNGDLYTMTDAGTLTDGSLAVVAGDTVAWDATNSAWYKAMDYAPSQYGTNEVHNLSNTITDFRTGDVIPVDGPDGTAKMSKDSLLVITNESALNTRQIKDVESEVMGAPIYGRNNTTETIAYAVDANVPVVVVVENDSIASSYYSVSCYDENDSLIVTTKSVLVDVSEKHEFNISTIVAIASIKITNTNSRTTNYCIRTASANDIAETAMEGKRSYIFSDSKATCAGSVNFKKNDKIKIKISNYGGSDGWYVLQLLTAKNGTYIYSTSQKLVETNSSFEVEIVLPADVTYCEFTNTNNLLSTFEIVDEPYLSLDNPCDITDLNTCISVQTNATVTKSYDKYVLTPSSTGSVTRTDITTKMDITSGDFVFIRADITPVKDCFVGINMYSQNSDGFVYTIGLRAGVKRTIYMRSGIYSTDSKLHIQVGLTAADNNEAGQAITIEKLIVCKNGYSAWRNEQEKNSLPEFKDGQTEYVVSDAGTGHFVTIRQGIQWLNHVYGSTKLREIATALYIRDGVYDMETSPNSQPSNNAAIYKPTNKISLFGESRDHTIIRFTNSSVCRVKVLDIGLSDCTIANLTIESLNDASYTDTSGGGHQNCYCIHMDNLGGYTHTEKYKTVLKNLKLVSTCHSPLGAGVGQYQDVIIDGCIFESRSNVGNSLGACYIHGVASGDGTMDSTISLSIRDCDFRSFDGTNAITLPSNGTSTFANIKTTINGMRVYSNGTPVNASVTDADLQPECSGNNVSALNLAEY